MNKVNGSKENTNSKNKIVYVFLCGILGIMVLVAVSIYNKYSDLKKEEVVDSIKEYFFDDDEMLKEDDILKIEGQDIKIDNYVFDLKEVLVDDNIAIGYLMIEITDTRGKLISEEQIKERFNIGMSITGTMNKKFIGKDNKINLFMDFMADKEFDYKLKIIDYKKIDNKAEAGYKTYIFDIPKTSNALTFKIDKKTNIYISSLGAVIESNKEIKNVYIDIYNEDGKKENLYDTKNNKYDDHMDEFGKTSITKGDSKEDDYYWYYDKFKEIRDISNIEYIIFNGKKYMNDK